MSRRVPIPSITGLPAPRLRARPGVVVALAIVAMAAAFSAGVVTAPTEGPPVPAPTPVVDEQVQPPSLHDGDPFDA